MRVADEEMHGQGPVLALLRELGAGSGEEIDALEPVEKQLRQLSLVESKRE